MPLVCPICKKEFTAEDNRGRRKYCSHACYSKANNNYAKRAQAKAKANRPPRQQERRQCLQCGKLITEPKQRKYCSRQCTTKAGTKKAVADARERRAEERALNERGKNYANRKCLRCGEKFLSDGFSNRICKKCEEKKAAGYIGKEEREVSSAYIIKQETLHALDTSAYSVTEEEREVERYFRRGRD